jgi:hypothetical protein
MRLLPCLALLLACPLLLRAAPASLREAEIAECRPGEISTWGDGRDRPAIGSPLLFVYSHRAAPYWFSATQVEQALARSLQGWAGCGVPARLLQGENPQNAWRQGAVLVQWNEQGAARNFGLANLGQRTLSLGPAAFELLHERNPGHPAEQTLQMVISHEMGHLFGVMAHSRRCVDVMSYYTGAKGEVCSIRDGSRLAKGVEYRALLPTACDVQRCRAANAGLPAGRP